MTARPEDAATADWTGSASHPGLEPAVAAEPEPFEPERFALEPFEPPVLRAVTGPAPDVEPEPAPSWESQESQESYESQGLDRPTDPPGVVILSEAEVAARRAELEEDRVSPARRRRQPRRLTSRLAEGRATRQAGRGRPPRLEGDHDDQPDQEGPVWAGPGSGEPAPSVRIRADLAEAVAQRQLEAGIQPQPGSAGPPDGSAGPSGPA